MARDPEVGEECGSPVRGKENVLGLDVAVNHAVAMRIVDGLAYLAQQRARRSNRNELRSGETSTQVSSGTVRQRDEVGQRAGLGLPMIQDREDVRMPERVQRVELGVERLDRAGLGDFLAKRLDHDLIARFHVLGQV